MAGSLPSSVPTSSLGLLKLDAESKIYECNAMFRGREVRVVVWIAGDRAVNTQAFAAKVDEIWLRIVRNYDAILLAATDKVEEAIRYFWQIEGEAAPTAVALMAASPICAIMFTAADKSERADNTMHRIMLSDDSELIGGHDLVIELDSEFSTVDAYFDG